MTLLAIVQAACDRLNLPEPTIVMTSTVESVRTLRGFALEEGRELARRTAWQRLTREHSFPTIATGDQGASSVPGDLGWIKPDTVFNRTRRRQMLGPIDDAEWQRAQASLIVAADPSFRIRGGTMLISPTPPAGETVAYEYVSNRWCQSAGGSDQSEWLADDDVPILDEELFTLGLVWRFRKAKGLDYAEDFRTYEARLAEAMLRDGVRPRLSGDAVSMDRVPRAPRVPDTLVF